MNGDKLKGRNALVTGGATGRGAIALALARAGVNVAIGSLPEGGALLEAAYAARPSLSEIAQTIEAIHAHGVISFSAPLNLRDDESIDRFHLGARSSRAHRYSCQCRRRLGARIDG
jgi:3-hydroxybutyrate dehydrogenase